MNKFPPIVKQGIPADVLQAAIKYVADQPVIPMCPRSRYDLANSRKNAASITLRELKKVHPSPPCGSGWAYEGEDSRVIAFGYHLILAPRKDDVELIPWANAQGDVLKCHANSTLFDAGIIAHQLVDYLDDLPEMKARGITWSRTIGMADGKSATQSSIHAHIILTPDRVILEECGLANRRLVDPRIISAKEQ